MPYAHENPRQWTVVKTRIAIDKITTPNFRFYVNDPKGHRITVTMRDTTRAVREAKAGQILFVYDRDEDHHLEVQIEVLPAGHPESAHPEPPGEMDLKGRLRSNIGVGGKLSRDKKPKGGRYGYGGPQDGVTGIVLLRIME